MLDRTLKDLELIFQQNHDEAEGLDGQDDEDQAILEELKKMNSKFIYQFIEGQKEIIALKHQLEGSALNSNWLVGKTPNQSSSQTSLVKKSKIMKAQGLLGSQMKDYRDVAASLNTLSPGGRKGTKGNGVSLNTTH